MKKTKINCCSCRCTFMIEVNSYPSGPNSISFCAVCGAKVDNLQFPKTDINISIRNKEFDWIKKRSKEHDMSINNTISQAIRALNLLDETPGAWEAVIRIRDSLLPPKYEPINNE